MIAIRVAGLLYGEEYDVVGPATIVVENGVIREIGGDIRGRDMTWAFAVPAPYNSHVHLGDSVAPEACSRHDLEGYVGARGLKHALIQLRRGLLIEALRDPIYTLHAGVMDYAEKPWICRVAREVLGGRGATYIGFGRAPGWDPVLLEEVVAACGGVGISDYSALLPHHRGVFRPGWLVSAHVSETPRQARMGDIYYIHSVAPGLRIAVHGTFLDARGLRYLADNDIYLALCPRSNLWFTGRLPDIYTAYRLGIQMLIGSDNAGCFHPWVMRDAEIVYSVLHSREPGIDPRVVLDMLYRNPAEAIGVEPPLIAEGRGAHILFIDKRLVGKSHDVHAAIIKRLGPAAIHGVIHGGDLFLRDTARAHGRVEASLLPRRGRHAIL